MDASQSGPSIEIAVGNRHRLASGVLLIFVFAGSVQAFASIWRRDAVEDVTTQIGGWLGAILVIVSSAVMHELLHLLGWKMGGHVPAKAISWVPTWRKLGIRVRLHTAVPAAIYRLGVVLPALVLGVVPVTCGLLTGNGLLLLWALFFLLECFSDFTALFATASVPSSAHVLEHERGWRIVT